MNKVFNMLTGRSLRITSFITNHYSSFAIQAKERSISVFDIFDEHNPEYTTFIAEGDFSSIYPDKRQWFKRVNLKLQKLIEEELPK